MQSSQTPAPVPDPSLRYLRAELGGRIAYLVLGYTDPGPDGQTEVYYSATGEVLKLRRGRLVGTAGLPLDWREVRQTGAPDWQALDATPAADPSAASSYLRERDVMPGYRFSIRDAVQVHAIASPGPLAGFAGASLRWFEERSRPVDAAAEALPPARFAVRAGAAGSRVVYSEQCLARGLCLRIGIWPPEADDSTDGSDPEPRG